jgi:hypothetical protein
VADAQASSIADFFGSTTEKVQRMLVLIASCIGQFIKAACLYFGFSICSAASRGSRASDAASFSPDARTRPMRGATGGSDASSRRVNAAADVPRSARPSSAARMPQAKLEKYLDQFTSGRKSRISQRQMANETGWSQSTMSRRLKRRSSSSK